MYHTLLKRMTELAMIEESHLYIINSIHIETLIER